MTTPTVKPSPVANNTPYLITVAIMALLLVIAIGGILMLRPDKDNASLVAEIIGFFSTTTAALLAFLKSQETHLSVNSRLDTFVELAEEKAHAVGRQEGVDAGMESAATLAKIVVPVITPTNGPVSVTITKEKT